MFVSKMEGNGSKHQVIEMNEKLSFQMGVIFTSSTYMDENMFRYIVQHLSKSAGIEQQSI